MTAAILSYPRESELCFLESILIDLLGISTESPDAINILRCSTPVVHLALSLPNIILS